MNKFYKKNNYLYMYKNKYILFLTKIYKNIYIGLDFIKKK